jgi:HEPN domain-containing protein
VSERERYEHHYQMALDDLESEFYDEAQAHAILAQAAATCCVAAAIDRLPGDAR